MKQNLPFFFTVVLGGLAGCDQVDIRPATANDCKQLLEHAVEVKCGKGILRGACKAYFGGLDLISGFEGNFIGMCVQHISKKDVSCVLQQKSTKGIELCLENTLPKTDNKKKE